MYSKNFINEAKEHLDSIEKDFLELERTAEASSFSEGIIHIVNNIMICFNLARKQE